MLVGIWTEGNATAGKCRSRDLPVDHARGQNELDALCWPKGTRLGRDRKHCANHPADGDVEQATEFSQVSVVAKQWPNEMEFSGERSESAATTG